MSIFAFFAIRQKTLAKKRSRALPCTRCAPDGLLWPSGFFSSYKRNADGTRVPSAGGCRVRTLGSLYLGRGRRPRRPVRRIISHIMAVLWAFGFFGASRRRPLPNDKSQRLPLGWGRSRRGKDAENVDGLIHRHSEPFPLLVAFFGYFLSTRTESNIKNTLC